MSTTTYVSDAMRSAIGQCYGRQRSYPISASDIRRWAIAIYHPEEPPRLFWDEAYAASTPYGGIVAPEDFNPFAWMTAEPAGLQARPSVGRPDDFVEGKLGVEGPGLVHMLNGGMAVTYGPVRMRPGDVISSETRLAEYREREGRLGLMLFTVSETTWRNQDGELVKATRNTLIRY
jgi:hypothetical protein